MSLNAEQLLKAVLALPEKERLEIAEAVIASLQPASPSPLDESWREVIRRRSAELRTGVVVGIPWEEVKRRDREPVSITSSAVEVVSMEEPKASSPVTVWPWRGTLAFLLLGVVGALGPDITPSRYWLDLDHYIPRYVLLALSVGCGLSAVRSTLRVDRLLGIAVVAVGCCMVAFIIGECVRILA